jgi:hypothetical protein
MTGDNVRYEAVVPLVIIDRKLGLNKLRHGLLVTDRYQATARNIYLQAIHYAAIRDDGARPLPGPGEELLLPCLAYSEFALALRHPWARRTQPALRRGKDWA